MKKIPFVLFFAVFIGFTIPAYGARISPDPSFALNVPDEWEGTNAVHEAPQAIKDIIDCANEDPGEIKYLGWKLAEDGRFQGAYCVSYQRRGMGRLRDILATPDAEKAKEAADKFIDSFASKLNDEYGRKRNMTISDLSADLMKADNDVIMVMDGMVTGGGVQYLRGIIVYLHNDALLNISSIHDKRAPDAVRQGLDGIPVSLKWQ